MTALSRRVPFAVGLVATLALSGCKPALPPAKVAKAVAPVKPKAIVALGATAARSLLRRA